MVCKVYCNNIVPNNRFINDTIVNVPEEGSDVTFSPVVDGSEENKEFFKYTPGGNINFYTVNKAIVDKLLVGIDINATHHKATAKGIVTGVATAVSIGKTLCCWDIVITNEDGQRTCTARITCMILAER